MDTVPITPNLTMLRVNGWQVYVWRDGESVTLIDTGAPGSGAEILGKADLRPRFGRSARRGAARRCRS
jgi:glyoxylase-like metal-dependent hydrolase (beta-lactamase superfamily II)